MTPGALIAVTVSAFFSVDGSLHPVGMVFFRCIGLAPEEGDLSNPGLIRRAQAFVSLITISCIYLQLGSLLFHMVHGTMRAEYYFLQRR